MLYIVGTPIGNLSDLSLRQAQTILDADIVLAEDTGSAGVLLSQIPEYFPDVEKNPQLRVISFHKDNEFERLYEVLEILKTDKKVVLISESGMPLISDPGFVLIQQLVKNNILFEVVPGPTAYSTALIYSGFNPQNSLFLGFLPKKPQDKKRIFSSLMTLKKSTLVFYESPFRIKETLEVLNEVQPNTDVVICRELTKKFEEIIRGKPSELLNRDYKGELTVVIKW